MPNTVPEEFLTDKEILLKKHAEFKALNKEFEQYITDCEAQQIEVDEAKVEAFKTTLETMNKTIVDLEKKHYQEGQLDHIFADVYMHDGFFGQVSIRISKRADFSVPTAYVAVRKYNNSPEIVLGFNPIFMKGLSKKHQRGVVIHELYHVIFQHIFNRSVRTMDKNIQKLHNIATDLAINSIIGRDGMPEQCLFPGVHPTEWGGKPVDSNVARCIAELQPMEASEYYFKKLREAYHKDEQENGGGGVEITISTFDDHDQWGGDDNEEISEELREEISNKIREAIEKGVLNADRSNSWGSVPHKIQEEIRKLVSREVDWRSVLTNFIGRIRSSERSSTVKKINKKVPYIFPGVRRKMTSKFACFIDQSGSMSDEDIIQLFGELENLAKEIEIDVFHFDTEVDEESKMVWKKGKAAPKTLRTRCGGTDFNCVANYCNNPKTANYDGVVILTDGYAPTMGGIKNAKVLWVITKTGTMEHIRHGDLVVKMGSGERKFKTY